MQLSKKECRALFSDKRKEITPNQLRLASEAISTILFTHFNLQDKTVSIFLPIERRKELNTYIILEQAINLDAKVGIPKANFDTNEMKHFLYEGPEQLELSEHAIPEPKYGKSLSNQKFDFIIVPLLAFDKKGYRVGYGKGFYDQFLAKCSSNCQFIGLSLFDPIDTITDVHEADIKLHHCITPNGKFSF